MNIHLQQASLTFQTALLNTLKSDEELETYLQGRIYDFTPHPKNLQYPYILLQNETVTDWSHSLQIGTNHTQPFLIATKGEGYNNARVIADKIVQTFSNINTNLTTDWHLVLWKHRNQQINYLKDGITIHLIITFSFILEKI
jgi:hypothetical protein